MGNCLSGDSPETGDGRNSRRTSNRRRNPNHPVVGKNQPLKHEIPKWKSEQPITIGQLNSKRDEFWDTSPAFEGRKEIWDALRAAAAACEAQDFDLAQAIVDGANIILPTGYLTDCYDELGNKYQLPVHVLSQPVNLITTDGGDKPVNYYDEESGSDVILKLRLSTGRDLKLTTNSRRPIGKVKETLAKMEDLSRNQRWFYGGKILNDYTRVDQLNIPKGHIIQVLLPYESGTEKPGNADNPTPVGS